MEIYSMNIAGRVCLEPIRFVTDWMLYKRWKTLDNITTVWKSSEPNWPTDNAQEENRPSADAYQKEFANHLMLLKAETLLVVNDKEKRERRFL
jgi:hypothetical protein